MKSSRTCAYVLFVVSACGFAGPGECQTGPAAHQRGPAPGEVFAIEAFVTDSNGSPVLGLHAADFELLEDGKPVAISGVSGRQKTTPTGSTATVASAPPLLLVFYLDTLGVSGSQLKAVFAGAEEALGQVGANPGFRAMVVSAGAPIAIRQGFTGDLQAVLQALGAAADEGGGNTAGPGADAGRAGKAVSGLTTFVASLGGLRGRKAVIVVGRGLQFEPDAVTAPDVGQLGVSAALSATHGTQAPGTLRDLTDKANAAGVTLYDIDVTGAADAGMRSVAAATGGFANGDGAAPADALAKMLADLASAYSLRFAPAHGGDGAAHELKLSVKRDGATARTRAAYFAARDADRMADRTLAAVLFNVADNPLGIQLSTTFEPKSKDGTPIVSVLVTIPIGNLSFAPTKVAHECDLGLWLAAAESGGRTIQAPRASLPVSVPNDRLLSALTQSVGYTFRVPAPAGALTIGVTVRDEIAMQAATALTTVAPAAEPTPGGTK